MYADDADMCAYTLSEDDDAVRQILKYTRPMSDEDSKLVAYPSTIGDKNEIFKWFGQNRGNSIQKPEINKILPELTDENQKIIKYKSKQKNKTYQNNNFNKHIPPTIKFLF